MIDLLKLLTKEELSYAKSQFYKKGSVLFFEGDECESVGFVKEGIVVINSYTSKGNEINYNTITPGHMFGNNLLFASNNRYRGNVIALTNTTVIYFNQNNFIDILQKNRIFLIEFLKYDSNFSKELNAKVKLLSIYNAEERFLYYLSMNDDKITFKSITELAKDLMLSRETLSRLVSRLTNEGVIKRKKNIIIKEL